MKKSRSGEEELGRRRRVEAVKKSRGCEEESERRCDGEEEEVVRTLSSCLVSYRIVDLKFYLSEDI